MSKVALITGGARGIGLAVAKTLARKGEWTFHIVDVNSELGGKAASELGNGSKSYRANVCSYKEMGDVFERAFQDKQGLDLVVNCAGILDPADFHARHPLDQLPPELDQSVNNVNYNATISTSYLAQHFFRRNPANIADMNLVLIASVTGLYPVPKFPLYVGSKHGVVGFARAISPVAYAQDRIKVNTICPGVVPTALYKPDEFDIAQLPNHLTTSTENVAEAVADLLSGQDKVDNKGRSVSADEAWGLTVEVNGDTKYFRDHVEFSDEKVKQFIGLVR